VHSARELSSSAFDLKVAGREVRLTDLFEGFGEHDRLGVIVGRPGGGLGASALITATITAFYDLQRARSPDFFIYPDYFVFHLGRPFGDHSRLDIWPAHKEVVVSAEPRDVRVAANAVVEGYVNDTLDPERRAAEQRARGAEARADEIAAHGDEISPSERIRIRREREGLVEDGVPVETYRRIALDEALGRLV
jgi:hypothetical protein